VPDITQALNAILTAREDLEIGKDLQQFANRHWSLPAQPLHALDALILGPATPAHSPSDLAVGLDWGKNRFGPVLGTPAPDAWLRLLRRPMRRKLRQILLRYHGPAVSAATRSRYRITLVWDITTLLKAGEMLGFAGLFYSGMLKRTAQSIEVVLLYAMIGEDRLCLPMDFRLRRPDPEGPGHPCKTALDLAFEMLETLVRSLKAHGLHLDGHFLVADAWFTDGKRLSLAQSLGLIPIVKGKCSFLFKGSVQTEDFEGAIAKLLARSSWTWKRSPQAPDVPYVRLQMTHATFGEVVVTLCCWPGDDEPGYLICLARDVSSPRIIRAYGRRPWVEACFEVCKATLQIERFKFRSPGGIYGFIALRFLSFALFDYAGRHVMKGKLSAGQIIRTLRYHGTLWLKQLLENKVLSTGGVPKRLSA
jgi:hypothetical protein